MLTQSDVVPYLLRRGLVGSRSVVDGKLTVVDVSRRNSTFEVISRDGPNYLLKQGVHDDGATTVVHEAAIYRLLLSNAAVTGLLDLVPAYRDYDADERVLILELVRDAENLSAYYERRGRFSGVLAAALGDALGLLHRAGGAAGGPAGDDEGLAGRPPRIFAMIHPDLGVFGGLSDATLRLLRAVQGSSALCDALDRLRDGWAREALIHGDIKWENWLVAGRATGGRQPRLKLVDWEFADLGDPCWDVGSVFADYLTLWLFSIPITGEQPPDRFLELARYPLERIQPALRAFWRAYVGRMGMDAATAGRALRRATAYGAARLVQSAFERTQVSFRLTGDLLYVVQLGLNMLQRPQEAIVHLLGIALDG